ncbi:MAG TPA: RtcB family protein [Verrucomicrobiae bacterium]|nr:RtcB family protein [Verrucomicrobiae bacterium]
MSPLEKITDYLWELPASYKSGMRVPGRIYATEKMLEHIVGDNCMEQVANVAFLPGIQRYSLAMPDIHWGYGFPIGGCCATDPHEGGVISPGGVGYDINCGVRLMRTNLKHEEVAPKIRDLVAQLFRDIPCGLGRGSDLRLSFDDERKCVHQGAHWAVEHGFGEPEDLDFIEERGQLADAEPSNITTRALERGKGQLGSLGSGNHFLEVQVVDELFDAQAAEVMGLSKGLITVMIHCGSRGFGYQVCDDYLKVLRHAPEKYGIFLPDRQLVSAPVKSPEGEEYLSSMRCAANYAFANRQVLMAKTETAFLHALRLSPRELGMELVYDVPHNIAKLERHKLNDYEKVLCVHRKGATRAFPPNHPTLPARYKSIGQPVLVPGDMGRYSFVLVGTVGAMEQTWGTVCHGAGRMMSRARAKKEHSFLDLEREMTKRGVVMMAQGRGTALEEAPWAYKDVENVVDVCHNAGIAKKVARLRPIGVVKG